MEASQARGHPGQGKAGGGRGSYLGGGQGEDEVVRCELPVWKIAQWLLPLGYLDDGRGYSMKWEQIKEKFDGEWVLIECIEVDDSFQVVEGEVLYHDPDKDKVYRKLLELRPKRYAIEYVGEIPKDLAVML